MARVVHATRVDYQIARPPRVGQNQVEAPTRVSVADVLAPLVLLRSTTYGVKWVPAGYPRPGSGSPAIIPTAAIV